MFQHPVSKKHLHILIIWQSYKSCQTLILGFLLFTSTNKNHFGSSPYNRIMTFKKHTFPSRNWNFPSIFSQDKSYKINWPYTNRSYCYMFVVFLFFDNFSEHGDDLKKICKPFELLLNTVLLHPLFYLKHGQHWPWHLLLFTLTL